MGDDFTIGEEHSREFLERKQLILMDRENIRLKHKCRVKELMLQEKLEKLNHENELMRSRIKSAEIRKSIEARYHHKE